MLNVICTGIGFLTALRIVGPILVLVSNAIEWEQLSSQGRLTNIGMPRREHNMAKKKDVVQVKNPRTKRYVKIDRSAGKIVASKKSTGPYKGVPIARKKK